VLSALVLAVSAVGHLSSGVLLRFGMPSWTGTGFENSPGGVPSEIAVDFPDAQVDQSAKVNIPSSAISAVTVVRR
jgi:hypothetical protein